MIVTQCKDDADTEIIKSVLQFAQLDSMEVRAEDGDILIMLVHHYNPSLHGQILLTTSKGSFGIGGIVWKFTLIQKRYLLFIYAFTGCDTVSAIYGFREKSCSNDSVMAHSLMKWTFSMTQKVREKIFNKLVLKSFIMSINVQECRYQQSVSTSSTNNQKREL